jgi:DNA repair protein RadA/Sms
MVADLDGAPGSVGQVRESTLRLMAYAKGEGIAVILAGHVTKDGSIAGPKTLEHLVDAVLSLEGERTSTLRLLRATKNRFGSTDEVGVFEMRERGLAEVTDPARAFLADHDEPAPGSVIAPTLEGSRPLLVEVQALVAAARYGSPTRRASGLDPEPPEPAGRSSAGGSSGCPADVYANLAGGLTVVEPASRPAAALALASSLRDRPVPTRPGRHRRSACSGAAVPVPGLDRRLRRGCPARLQPGDRARLRAGSPARPCRSRSRSSRSRRSPMRSVRRSAPAHPGVASPCRRC